MAATQFRAGPEQIFLSLDSSQFVLTPPITVGPLRIPANDEHVRLDDTKPASDIYPTERPTEPLEWTTRVKKAVNMLFLLHGDVTEDQLRFLLGELPEVRFQEIKKASFSSYKSSLKSSMFGTGENSWLMNFVSSEVQLENVKVRAFNLFRECCLLRIRQDGQSDGDYDRCIAKADRLSKLSDILLECTIKKYKEEMTGLHDGARSPFRFKERTIRDQNNGIRKKIVAQECERLQGIVNQLQGYVAREFAVSGVADPSAIIVASEVPAEREQYGFRSPYERRNFWKARCFQKVLNSYCRAHLPYVEIPQITSAAFKRKITLQFMANCDFAFWLIVEPRLWNENLTYVEDPRLRVSGNRSTEEGTYFTQMRHFHQQYVNQKAYGNTHVPTVADLLVKSNDTMDST